MNYSSQFSTNEGYKVRQQVRGRVLIPEENRRSSGIAISLLIVVFLALFATHWHERQTIEQIEIAGATNLSALQVQAIANRCLSKPRSIVELADVRMKVEQIPFVKKATVHFSGIRNITVDVLERIPVAYVVQANGSLRLVDAEGILLPPTHAVRAFNIPLLRCTNNLTNTTVRRAVQILNCAESTLQADLFQSISEVVIDGDGSVVVLTDRLRWRLGRHDIERVSDAFADMNVFWSRTSSSRLAQSATEIDLRWKHHIVVRSGTSTVAA